MVRVSREPSIRSFITSPPSLKRPAGSGGGGRAFDCVAAHVLPCARGACSRVKLIPKHISSSRDLAEILVLAGGAIIPAPPPASTRISARMKHVLGHSSPVNVQVSRLSLGEDTRIGVIKCQVPRES